MKSFKTFYSEAKKPKPGHNAAVLAKNISKVMSSVKKEETELDENIGGLFKDASEWERSAKARGLVVKSMTHPSGEATKYQIAKDKQGNNRGHFDHGTKSGRLHEEYELDEAATPKFKKGDKVHYETSKYSKDNSGVVHSHDGDQVTIIGKDWLGAPQKITVHQGFVRKQQ